MERVNSSEREPNPREKASWFSVIFFLWTYDVIKKGHTKPYTADGLCMPLRLDCAQNLGDRLENAWNEDLEVSKKECRAPSLFRALVKTFWTEFLQITVLHSINEFFVSLSRPVLLGLFLTYFRSDMSNTKSKEVVYVGIMMMLSYGLFNLLQNHFLSQAFHLSCKLKVALSSLIYRKCLKLSCGALRTTATGQVVNLSSNDLRRMDDIVMYCHYALSAPVTTLIALSVIYCKVGFYAAAVCVISIFCFIPVQVTVAKIQAKNRAKVAKTADGRIRMMDEIINGIYTIKVYAWEKPYTKMIGVLRRAEISVLKKVLYLRAVHLTVALFSSKFTLYATLVTYTLCGGIAMPEMVFMLAGFFRIIARVMCALFFRSIGECSECLVSIGRLQNFMELEEFKERIRIISSEKSVSPIVLRNVSTKWSTDVQDNTISDINLSISSGNLVGVIGTIGSGKSSLLSAILGELPTTEGKIEVNGSVSYYSQVPWIFGGTIRQNIIFCENFNPERYRTVVDVCALNHDFKLLPDGEFSIIGERGVTLSGGQKARIALARAVYKEADIYLLDDPLSAVDARVGKHIFERCISGFLQNKTRVLVTHQLQYLSQTDHIVVMNGGRIEVMDTPEEVFKRGNGHFKTFVNENAKHSEKEFTSQENMLSDDEMDKMEEEIRSGKRKELEEEENEETYQHPLLRHLIRGVGVCGILTVSLCYAISQVFVSMSDIWLSYWTGNNAKFRRNGAEIQTMISNSNKTVVEHYLSFDEPHTTEYFLIGYTTVVIGITTFAFLRSASLAYTSLKCSSRLHKDALKGVVCTDLAFFNNNPSGRILNRFSKDLGVVDETLPQCLADSAVSFMQVIGAFVVSAMVRPVYLIPGTVAFCLLFYVRNFYLKASVNLKRLEGVTQSPVYVYLHATLQGLPVIRANGSAHKLISEFDQLQNVHTAAWYLYSYTAFGYVYCLEMICFFYLIAIVIGCLSLNMSSSQAGLALIQVMTLLSFVQWAMKQGAEVSNQVTSVDRLLHYATLPPEPQLKDKLSEKSLWPTRGKIVFENVSVLYDKNSVPAIRDVSFVVLPHEKVGIVGRTGAGKTTLVAALLRLAKIEGSIKIDDVDTSNIPLRLLRSKISVIPQDPVLFSGTLKKNLDPFEEHTDAELWNALSEVELQKTSQETDRIGLNSTVLEGGRNFSVGQRQLICLARAAIRNNDILVLDEATANVDQETDRLIQQTIRKKFQFCTVLTVAHRLHTVMDSDKILVIDSGVVAEFGHPYVLLQNDSGVFYNLVQETGDFANTLMDIAKKNYVEKKAPSS